MGFGMFLDMSGVNLSPRSQDLTSEVIDMVPESPELKLIGLEGLVSLRYFALKVYDGRSAIDVLRCGGVPQKLEELNILWLSVSRYNGLDSDLENAMKVQLREDDKIFASLYASGKVSLSAAYQHHGHNATLGKHEDSFFQMRLQDCQCLPFIHGTGILILKSSIYNDRNQFMQGSRSYIAVRGRWERLWE